jgi:hypothetical protein
MPKKNNMYSRSVKQWNPATGCGFDCRYCRNSFQRQQKRWAKAHCERCYRFIPHEHPERLDQPLPRTSPGQFIFTCSSGDIAFTKTEYLEKVVSRIRQEPNKTFLLQSKDPRTFGRVDFPDNVILGITLETNRDDGYSDISRAPVPSRRYRDFLDVRHPLKMVTIEPVLDLDGDVLVNWINAISPCLVWLGHDSGKNRLPEPPLAKLQSLYQELGSRGFTLVLKMIRKAWWEHVTGTDAEASEDARPQPALPAELQSASRSKAAGSVATVQAIPAGAAVLDNVETGELPTNAG